MGKKHKAITGEIITAAGSWRDVLLVCRKCSRKLDGGFGENNKESLRDAFRQLMREAGRRQEVRVLEVACLGLCPKKAVTVIRGGAPGEMMVVPEGLDLGVLVQRIAAQRIAG